MPSASPALSTPVLYPSPVPTTTFDPGILIPTLGPFFPKAGAVGVLVIALAYFSLGVAVGALLKHSPRARRWLPILVIPGVVAAVVFFVWVIRSLR